MTEQPDTRAIEDALDRLLRGIIKHKAGKARSGPLRFFSAAELAGKPIRSRRQAAVDAIIRDPVNGPRRHAIRLLGERLFEVLGSTDAMLPIAERVANRDPKNWGRRIDILDKRWDGIGAENDRWIA